MNFQVKDLAYRFKTSTSTISRIFLVVVCKARLFDILAKKRRIAKDNAYGISDLFFKENGSNN